MSREVVVSDTPTTTALALADEVLVLDEKATPGPWHTEKTFVLTADEGNVARALRKDAPLGEIGSAEAQARADARLIARYRTAAAELARALKEAVERAERAEAPLAAAVRAEREACAKAVEQYDFGYCTRTIAASIRRRVSAALAAAKGDAR